MSVAPGAMPLQLMCQLILAGQVIENVTLPLNRNSTLAQTTDARVLPSGYVAFPEFGLAYKPFEIAVSHNKARKKCLNRNGQLAVIDTREKVEKILKRFSRVSSVWAGVGQYGDTEEWITIDGKSTNDLPWGNGFPRGKNSRCAYLSRESNAIVSNNCKKRHRYLCQIALPKN